ncbi:MAG: tRNA uridine-5-carboxymethylaminomethyl(34) synthesis GTPase MnmE [Bacteroidales bacterium]|nr:tRNA uridine-5-carboxymethylaminomethyl(34) synthesis GTPase MnmE [Bacteroidales bacterium]
MNRVEDTICAIATAQGGAIGLIRVSGPEAITATASIFKPMKEGRQLEKAQPYSLTFGQITDGKEVIDEVLVSLFRAPHSYTGEDSTEIACHGSSYILQRVLQLLIQAGCRLAMPGEYTQRAYLNGKMDLSQAEAVADLIASTSAATHRLAMSQMRGGFSKELGQLRDQLLHFTSLIELELDFSDHEDIEFADRSELFQLADHIEQVITRLTDSFRVGNALKKGVPVAIVGKTNVGKSTLLNRLLHEDRAIVSDIHGTTRDVIEDTIIIGGITFRFIDTAGLRETTDAIEQIGIKRAYQKLEEAQIVLWLIDTPPTEEELQDMTSRCEGKKLIIVRNKADKQTDTDFSYIKSQAGFSQLDSQQSLNFQFSILNFQFIELSAKFDPNIDALQRLLVQAAEMPEVTQADVIVTNARHYEALTHALEAIQRVQQGLHDGLSGDFLSQDIRECIYHLSDIVGEVTADDVLQNIFKHFCVGK